MSRHDPGSGGPDDREASTALHAQFDLPLRPEAVAIGRRTVADLLRTWAVGQEPIDDALLIASELVGNAVRHSARQLSIELTLLDGVLEIAVDDGSGVLPEPRDLDPYAESGRGLAIIDALCIAWGTQTHADGKRVWARLKA